MTTDKRSSEVPCAAKEGIAGITSDACCGKPSGYRIHVNGDWVSYCKEHAGLMVEMMVNLGKRPKVEEIKPPDQRTNEVKITPEMMASLSASEESVPMLSGLALHEAKCPNCIHSWCHVAQDIIAKRMNGVPRTDNPKDDDLDMRMKLVAWVNDNADRGLTSVDVAGVRRIVDVSRPAKALFNCGARKANTGAGDPAECDWPHCGCDPHADKVIEALNEQGMLRDPREQRVVHASCTPTTDFGCEARAKLAKARGALTSVLQELIDMGGSSSEELIEEVTRALEESAQPQPCET